MVHRAKEREHLRLAQAWGASPKAFNGWVPTYETTYEYDDAGRMVRSVTRQLEPEWDDHTRALAEALAEYDEHCCPGCGLHESILSDPERHRFTFDERLCQVCAAQQQYGRIVAKRDDLATPRDADGKEAWPSPQTPRPGDGRHIFLRPLTPDELKPRRDPNKPERT